jgi:GNAT superfamily N-acetyltransferase
LIPEGVSTRLATPEDTAFEREVVFSVLLPTLMPLGLPPAQLEPLLEMQARGREMTYRQNYPEAEFRIIEVDGGPVGILILDRGEPWRIIDIALHPANRGKGVGTGVLASVLAEAEAAHAPVELQVESISPARRLYERLGFQAAGEDGIRTIMRFEPSG